MRRSLVTLALLGMLSLVPHAAALGLLPADGTPGDPTPNAPNAVHARYTLVLRPGLDALDAAIVLNIMELEVRGPNGLPAQAIRDGGPTTRDLFEAAVRETLGRELEKAFPGSGAQISSVTFDYGASDSDEDLYRPGIGVRATARLPLSSSLLGMAATTGGADDWARAFFYSGGSARIEKTLQVPPGFDAGIRIEVPASLQLASPGRQVGAVAEFTKNNTRGFAATPMYVRFEVGLLPQQVPMNVRDGPLVQATFRADDATPLWLQAVPFTDGRYVADLDLVIVVPSLSSDLFEEALLPANLRLDHISADLIRVAAREGLVDAEQLEGYFQALIQQGLREDFGNDTLVTVDSAAFRKSLDVPVGGAQVTPLELRAHSRLPIKDDHMLSSSAMARSIGMITGTPGSFDLSNGGDWRLELTLLYPKGADIDASDSLDRLEEVNIDGRQGFRVYLAPGESTNVDVWGRPQFEAALFAIGMTEIVVLVTGAIFLARWGRARLRAKRFPWIARG